MLNPSGRWYDRLRRRYYYAAVKRVASFVRLEGTYMDMMYMPDALNGAIELMSQSLPVLSTATVSI